MLCKTRDIILLASLVGLLTLFASTPNLDFSGSDIINPYRYYQNLLYGADFFDFVPIYDGREYEVTQPLLIKLISIVFQDLSINGFAFLMCLFINETIVISLYYILSKKNNFFTVEKLSVLVLIFFVIVYPYGIVQQLLRQSLSISFVILSILFEKKLPKIIIYILAICSHISSIYIIFYLIIFRKKIFDKYIFSIYLMMPILIVLFLNYIIGYHNPMFYDVSIIKNSINNFKDHLDMRDFIWILSTIIISLYSLYSYRNKLIFKYNSTLCRYYLIYFLYFLFGMHNFFQRYFLINFIIFVPLAIIIMYKDLIDKYLIILVLIAFISLLIINYFIKTLSGHYFQFIL